MNENIDLTKILKDCPIGWEFYSSIYGNVNFRRIENNTDCPIVFFFIDKEGITMHRSATKQGIDAHFYDGECTLFPSKDQQDWSKFTAPWYKKERFYTLSSDYNITYDTVDWCNKNHFDYRGLIEKGLAIDTTNLNIY